MYDMLKIYTDLNLPSFSSGVFYLYNNLLSMHCLTAFSNESSEVSVLFFTRIPFHITGPLWLMHVKPKEFAYIISVNSAVAVCSFSRIEYPSIPYRSQLSSRSQVSENPKSENSNSSDSMNNMKSSRFLLRLLIFMWHKNNDAENVLLDSDVWYLKLESVK